jgi:competence protein ComEC
MTAPATPGAEHATAGAARALRHLRLTATGPPQGALRTLRIRAAEHPRHLLLAALTGGLLAGPRSPLCLLALAVLAIALAANTTVALTGVAMLLAGAGIAEARLAALDRSALGPLLDRELSVRATLLDHPRTRSFGTRVAPARLLSAPGRGERVLLRLPARIRWPPAAQPGAELAARGRLVRLAPFDAYERRRNAHAVLRVASIRATGRHRGGLLGTLDAVRERTERVLTAGVPPPQGALARGMVLGQDAALPDSIRDDFRRTGLAHLVAASGANVLLLATLVLALATIAGLGLTARLTLALALVAAYVPLAGAGPSIQRAGVMGATGLVAVLAGRPGSRWYALLLAAALTLAWSPRAAEDAGWQLSFAAVLAMFALVPVLRSRLRRSGLPHGIAEALAVTVAATLGTAPLIALHFERLSLVSLPANLLAAPAVAPIMWLGTTAGLLGQLTPALAAPVAGVAALPLAYVTWLAHSAAGLPFAELRVPSPSLLAVAGIYAAAAGVALGWRRLGTRRRPIGTAVAVAAIGATVLLALGARRPQPPADLTVSFLDIGQGDATLIQHGRAAVLVDTGPPDGPILTRLRAAGVRRLDLLVLTHAALDHDGAAAAVLGALPVGLVLDGEEQNTPPERGPFGMRAAAPVALLAAARHVRRLVSDAGQVLRVGPLQLRVLWPRRLPAAPPGAEPNDRATVLHVRDGPFDLLLAADAESNVTAGLELPVVDALKVAHHGSDDPGLPGLLRRLRPRVAVISAGAHNSYGHPTPATLAALHAVPVVRRTDRDGTVRLIVRGGRIAVEAAS